MKPTKAFIHKTYKERKGLFSDNSYIDLNAWYDGNISLRTFHQPRSTAYVVLSRRNVRNLIKVLQKADRGWKL